MKCYPDVCLQSLCRFGSLSLSETTLKELKQRRFVNFQTIPCFYDYDDKNNETSSSLQLTNTEVKCVDTELKLKIKVSF